MLHRSPSRALPLGTRVNAPTGSYAMTVAASLLHYAQANAGFASQLWQLIVTLPGVPFDGAIHRPDPTAARLILPQQLEAAQRRASWLIEQLDGDRLEGATEARQLLQQWAAHHPQADPSPLVVGMMAVAIPGITLGRISRRVAMACLLRRDVPAGRKFDVARLVTQATHGVLNAALHQVGGELGQLEPEVADWFFGERPLAFYAAKRDQLGTIVGELTAGGIAHAAVEDGGATAVLAISPAVYPDWNIRAIDR